MNHRVQSTYAAGTDEQPKDLSEYFEYDADGNLVRHVGTGGPAYESTYEYDGLNRRTVAIDPEGHEERFEYDRYGNVKRHVNPFGETNYKYDRLDRPTEIIDAYGHSTLFSYAHDRNVTYETDAPAHDHLLLRRPEPVGPHRGPGSQRGVLRV